MPHQMIPWFKQCCVNPHPCRFSNVGQFDGIILGEAECLRSVVEETLEFSSIAGQVQRILPYPDIGILVQPAPIFGIVQIPRRVKYWSWILEPAQQVTTALVWSCNDPRMGTLVPWTNRWKEVKMLSVWSNNSRRLATPENGVMVELKNCKEKAQKHNFAKWLNKIKTKVRFMTELSTFFVAFPWMWLCADSPVRSVGHSPNGTRYHTIWTTNSIWHNLDSLMARTADSQDMLDHPHPHPHHEKMASQPGCWKAWLPVKVKAHRMWLIFCSSRPILCYYSVYCINVIPTQRWSL